MSHVIVIDGGKSGYTEGALLNEVTAAAAEMNGAVLLPVDPGNFKPGSIAGAGYTVRRWGGGYPIDGIASRLHAPLVVYMYEGAVKLNWAIAVKAKGELNGRLQVTVDSQQAGTGRFGLSHHGNPVVNLNDLQKTEKAQPDGSYLIKGYADTSVACSGYAGLALYGAGQDVNIMWFAATVV